MSTDRVVIAGGPRTGKTTLAAGYPGATLHTDDLIAGHDWSGASQAAAEWMAATPGPWVAEGVATVRALRKALAAGPGTPCDVLVWLDDPRVPLTPGQQTMRKGCETVLAGIVDELLRRGVTIRVGP